ncbi:MAG: 4-hydroxy-tetrahydrodipicolinate synthase [Acidimicrobiales bacterium]
MPRFGTVLTAMVTPFDDDLGLDLDGAVGLARWLADHGNDGLIVAGTTGEGATLSDAEKLDLWRAVSEAVTIPVVAGTGTYDTRHTVELTTRAKEVGAAGVLVVTPYYNRPSQAGLEAHFRAAAAATDLPMLIYDIPIRTGRKVAHDVLVRLSHDVGNVVGVKDAALDVSASARLAAAARAGFEIYSGNDDQTLPLLSIGAVGVVGVCTHWSAPEMAEMIASFEKGDVVAARGHNARLLPSYDFETGDAAPNPVPTKAMLRVLGLPAGPCRPPMGPEPDGLAARAGEVLAGLGRRPG